MTTWPFAYPVAVVAGLFVQLAALMWVGWWGLLAVPVTVVVMVAVIGLLDDRLRRASRG